MYVALSDKGLDAPALKPLQHLVLEILIACLLCICLKMFPDQHKGRRPADVGPCRETGPPAWRLLFLYQSHITLPAQLPM